MKYGNKKALCSNNHVHDSKAEANRCNELHLLQQAGLVSDLKIQAPYILLESGKYKRYGMSNEVMVKYIADFDYYENGMHIVEDLKSPATAKDSLYVLKRKLFKSRYCSDGEIIFKENITNGKANSTVFRMQRKKGKMSHKLH